jgi:succinate dehydrogenase/fumarate reductase flavoprotein subunit
MLDTDLLIIGSGFAGLWAAIAARGSGVENVAIVDKGSIGLSSMSRMAAGGTIFCLPKHDGDQWLADFAEAHGYLCRQDIVADIIDTSYSRLRRLNSWGLDYRRIPLTGRYYTLPSRGLPHARMLVAPRWKGRVGGAALVGALLEQVETRDISLYPKVMVTDLLQKDGRVCGAVGVQRVTGEAVAFSAGAVVLAVADCSFRGNYACVDQVTGDGFRLAYDLGARLNNMEFLAVNTGSPGYGFEGTGAAARWGGRFLNRDFKPFMGRYAPDADRAEIGYLVRAMAAELVEDNGPPFYFDMSRKPGSWLTKYGLSSIGGWMPLNIRRLEAEGVRLFRSPQEWVPAVQSLRGGIRTDAGCMSDIPGLFAAGLCQSIDPGLFNGWSSMRAMWSGERAGETAAGFLHGSERISPDSAELRALEGRALSCLGRGSGVGPDAVCGHLQEVLFPYTVCIRKREDRLRDALAEVERIRDGDIPSLRASDPHELVKAHETASMVLVAELFLRASIERKETRGDHFREDYPETDNGRWLQWVNIRKGPDGRPSVELEPVPLSSYRYRPEERSKA